MPTALGPIRDEIDPLCPFFTKCPNDAWDDPALRNNPLAVLLRLRFYAWRRLRYPGHEAFAADCGLTVRTLKRYLDVLEEATWIRRYGGGPGNTVGFTLPDPQPALPRLRFHDWSATSGTPCSATSGTPSVPNLAHSEKTPREDLESEDRAPSALRTSDFEVPARGAPRPRRQTLPA